MSYADGFEKIDWELMQQKDYSDDKCKSVCMAECLSPNKVEITNIAAIYVKTEEVCKKVKNVLNEKLKNHSIFVNINENMFVKNERL